MANRVDSDETPRSAASHLGLHCLLRPVCPNAYGKYGAYLYRTGVNHTSFEVLACINGLAVTFRVEVV